MPTRLTVLFTALVWVVLPRTSAAQTCDRACLTMTLEAYLASVVKHDPAAAPLAPTFRYTENALDVQRGEGIWKSATRLGAVQRRYVDAVSGQAVYFGIIEEGQDSGIATLRIKVVNRQVTEGELVIGRRANGIFSAEGLAAAPPPERAAAD